MSPFLDALFAAIRPTRLRPEFERNVDPDRFPDLRRWSAGWIRLWATGLAARAAYALGWITVRKGEADQLVDRLREVVVSADGLSQTYDSLADDRSRRCLIDVLGIRAVGPRWYRLPQNNPEYWRAAHRAKVAGLRQLHSSVVEGSPPLNEYDLTPIGFDVRFEVNAMHVINTFVAEQYRYRGDRFEVAAEPGDIVIDGGGCWGDTALYFASRVGQAGRVYCFEFVPSNLSQLHKNLSRNPHLAPRVEVVTEALWERSGEELEFSGAGASTSVVRQASYQSAGGGRLVARTCTVDDMVAAARLPRVDFIKMDIEGAELPALRGAVRTLRAFRPKLAVSVYHSLGDMVRIPEFLDGLDLGYELFLDHFTIHAEETILFARPSGGRAGGHGNGT